MSIEDKKKCLAETLEWQLESRLKTEPDLKIDEGTFKIIKSEGFCKHFIDDFCFMAAQCTCLESDCAVTCAENAGFETIVVENAQGLLLDERYAPIDKNGRRDVHSTPSMTGLAGALKSLGENVDPDDVIPNYVTRSYITRHGAGPFPEETTGLKYEDLTNVNNEYQGSMRFGKIDCDTAKALFERTLVDAHSCHCVPRLAVTHLNEARCLFLEENANYLSFEDDSSKIKERKAYQ